MVWTMETPDGPAAWYSMDQYYNQIFGTTYR